MITILTPSYNRAHTLTRLFESLIQQSNQNFEWLIVDDGSHDKTFDLVSDFIGKNKINIKYFFQENKGITCKKYNLDLFIDDKERVLDDVKKAGIKTLRITDDKESKHDIVHNWLEIKDYVDSLGV